MIIFQYILLLILFLVELATLASFTYWGFSLDKGIFLKVLCGIGSPVSIAVFWGMYLAPKANFPVSPFLQFILKVIIFTLAAAALLFSGRNNLAAIFLGVSILTILLSYLMKV